MSIEFDKVIMIEIQRPYDLMYKTCDFSTGLLCAASHHPCHEPPETHVHPGQGRAGGKEGMSKATVLDEPPAGSHVILES